MAQVMNICNSLGRLYSTTHPQKLRTIRENEINLLGDYPDAGGFSDVYTGMWTNSSLHGTEKVTFSWVFISIPILTLLRLARD